MAGDRGSPFESGVRDMNRPPEVAGNVSRCI